MGPRARSVPGAFMPVGAGPLHRCPGQIARRSAERPSPASREFEPRSPPHAGVAGQEEAPQPGSVPDSEVVRERFVGQSPESGHFPHSGQPVTATGQRTGWSNQPPGRSPCLTAGRSAYRNPLPADQALDRRPRVTAPRDVSGVHPADRRPRDALELSAAPAAPHRLGRRRVALHRTRTSTPRRANAASTSRH